VTAPQVSEICANVKHLAYAAPERIRLYGEEIEVVLDPFPEAIWDCGSRHKKKRPEHSRTAYSPNGASEDKRAESLLAREGNGGSRPR
jgi:hypothetical protein